MSRLHVKRTDVILASRTPEGIPRLWEIFRAKWWELMKLSVCTGLLCLPVITIPAALTAMTACLLAMIHDQPQFLLYSFRSAFNGNFRKGTLLGGTYLLLLLLCAVGAWVYFNAQMENALVFNVCGAVMLGSAQVLLLAMYYAYPMLIATELPLKKIFRNSILLVFLRGNICRNLQMLAGEALLVFLCYWFYPYSIVLLAAVWLALFGLLVVYLAWLGLEQYVLKETGEAPAGAENQIGSGNFRKIF